MHPWLVVANFLIIYNLIIARISIHSPQKSRNTHHYFTYSLVIGLQIAYLSPWYLYKYSVVTLQSPTHFHFHTEFFVCPISINILSNSHPPNIPGDYIMQPFVFLCALIASVAMAAPGSAECQVLSPLDWIPHRILSISPSYPKVISSYNESLTQ